ncbi:unnamed protein product [Callosobruchus maculatus]|uniref:Uncharacterized protein n=1 Tax=Callosobruchus maculatus TaxID=64391 RepID=A0A653CTY6_CALMS|nr:unnamed protein product [Callosobruchus maculatus]
MDTADWIVKSFFITRNMFFDNKGMVTPTPSERACPPPVHVNIGADTEKPPQQDSPPFRIWRKVRLPHAINGFLAVFGE